MDKKLIKGKWIVFNDEGERFMRFDTEAQADAFMGPAKALSPLVTMLVEDYSEVDEEDFDD
jgi:hypothetical protein